MEKKNIILFGMDNSIQLAEKISKIIKIPLTKIQKTTYADGENMIVSEQTVRGRDVFIIANTGRPVNDNIMQLLLFIDSLKRASARTITVCLSYYGYARQDRKASGRQPIGAKLVANLLQVSGATKLICIDLHNPSIQGFFDIPLDDLRAQYTIAQALKTYNKDFTVVSPDHGGTVRARKLAEIIDDTAKICVIDKRRTGVNQSEIMGIIGDINDQNAVIIDDIIDTGGTIIKAAEALKQNGAKDIVIAATHGLFSKGFEIFENNDAIKQVIITDSIDNSELASKYKKLKIVSLGDFLAKVIKAQYSATSVSEVYLSMKEELRAS
ncbi:MULTISPECIES: ribose-phosphate pyrophosphokinase [unclassified Mycoplasma]|uniref:ribose-phosphate pyrophosphokinase n=1 Tax=unclassified Mycoplasma TaxID=2683645 RepID=UPI00211C4E4F|nr:MULTISPECIES: ribose-phosphate pyrophosphokinase [unclassified Mycoplasma]UUM19892.1 ribose-phosphate pyrophosphokinase [Mycoplasma sp. 1578d]UUM24872.1 ribose-phosphate pyrophosphokinase [Mycoplasma sp. 3686d]